MRNVPEGSRICVQTQVGRLGSKHCDPQEPFFQYSQHQGFILQGAVGGSDARSILLVC